VLGLLSRGGATGEGRRAVIFWSNQKDRVAGKSQDHGNRGMQEWKARVQGREGRGEKKPRKMKVKTRDLVGAKKSELVSKNSLKHLHGGGGQGTSVSMPRSTGLDAGARERR